MKNFKTEGIVIKRRNIGEADKIITVFTKDHGKLQIKATGIRRIPSRRSAHVELLNHANLTLYKGPGFPILTEASTINHFAEIKNKLARMGYAYHLCELIDTLCPENQETPDVFYLFKNILTHLSSKELGRNAWQIALQNFEIELLNLLGYWQQSPALSANFDTHTFIETIIERKLKSRNLFAKLG